MRRKRKAKKKKLSYSEKALDIFDAVVRLDHLIQTHQNDGIKKFISWNLKAIWTFLGYRFDPRHKFLQKD